MTDLEVICVPTDDLAAATARWMADAILEAVAARGQAHVALSGGSTPSEAFVRLSTVRSVDWSAVHLWQVDERCAPDGDEDRNATMLARTLGQVVPAFGWHLMDVSAEDLDAAATRYGVEFDVTCGGVLDLVQLGIGVDGHTASWPPGDPVVDRVEPVAVIGPYRGRRRMTLTPAAVNAARGRLVVVRGASKAAVMARFLDADPAIPASRVARAGTTLICDEQALASPSSSGEEPAAR